jgi:hypothetical protein
MSGGILPPFLTLAVGEGERSPSNLFLFTPWERAAGTRWVEAAWASESFQTLRRRGNPSISVVEPGPSSPSLY